MLRGVITLLAEELKVALSVIPESYADRPIMAKINAALASKNNVKHIQVDENELEMLIDNLGEPGEGETEVYISLRRKLQDFLYSLKW